MKLKSRQHFVLSCLPATLALCLSLGSTVRGTSLFWDGGTADIAGGGDSASAGGTGTWNTTLLNWDAGIAPHVAWTAGNDAVFAGAAGTVTLGTNISAGNLALSTNNYTIATAAGSALTLSAGATTAGNYHQINGAGGLTLTGAQTFDITGGLRVTAAITGSETITKSGPGMLGFNGTNTTYTGKIVVNTGRFGVTSDAALGAVPAAPVADAITLNSSILVNGVTNNATNGFDNGGIFTINANRGITLAGTGGTLQVGYGTLARLTVGGPISGVGSLTKTDSGDLVLNGTNTYPGGTTISGGALSIGDLVGNSTNEGSNSGLGTGDVSVAGGAQLMLSGNNLTIGNNITLNGAPTVNTRQGALVGGFQDGNSANVLTGTLTLAGTGNRSVSTWWSDKILTLSGKVTGTGTLQVVNIKTDNSNQGGIIILNNATNDYSGGTLVSAGNNPTLRLGISDAIPDGTGKGNVTVDGRLELNGLTDTINGLSGTGAVVLGAGGVLIAGNADVTSSFTGTVNGTTTGSLRKIGTGTLTLGGAADNTNCRVRVDAGTLVLAKTNSATAHAAGSQGGTDFAAVINGGTLSLGGTGGDQLFERSAVQMTGGTFDFAGLSEGFDGLTGDAGTVTNSVAATTSTLTLGQNNSVGSPVFAGIIQNGAGTMALTKTGTGTQTLTGVNTYTGATTVSAGNLFVTGSLAPTSAITVADGSLLGGSGSVGPVTTVGTTSILRPGGFDLATFNTRSVVLTGILDIQLDASTNDLLQVTGDLDVTNATLVLDTLDVLTETKYVIAKCTGTLTGTLSASFIPDGYTLVHDTTAKEIYLTTGAPASGFASFMDGFPGLTTEQKAAGADPDHDGVSNLVEYALSGFDPTVANGAPGTLSGRLLTFNKRAAAVTNNDLVYSIEQSTTLGVAPSPWTAVAPLDSNDGSTISLTLPAGLPKEFVRLKVERQN